MPEALFTDSTPADNWKPHLAAGTLWVMALAGQPIAFLAAQAANDRLHIDEFDVQREHQGQGVGRRMLAGVADWARVNGFQALSLTTFRHIPWNGPFYATFGFREWIDPPATIRQALTYEAARGLKDRWAMRLDL